MWTFNSIRIFAQEYENINKQISARLSPLGGGTEVQFFGWENTVTRVSAYIVGYDDLASLKAMNRTGTSYNLTSPDGSYGNFFLNNVSAKMIKSICQTLRTDLSETAPVFLVEMELYHDE